MEALDGITVVQVLGSLPHNYCTFLLADLGADVIKVQPTVPRRESQGHSMRDRSESVSDVVNRNKRSIVIDLKRDEGKGLFYRLVERADVVVDGMRPGAAKKLGIDYESLLAYKRDLVYCGVTVYGQDGPYAGYAGHDHNSMAVSGMLAINGDDPQAPPVIPAVPVGDMGSGVMGAFAIMAALRARDRHGIGQFVDVSMTDLHVSFLSLHFAPYFSDGIAPKRGGERTPAAYAPWLGRYRCKDGKYVMMDNFEAHFWAALCLAIGKPEWVSRSFTLNKTPEDIAIADELAKIMATRTRDEWFRLLAPKGVAISPVNEFDEMLDDPQVAHRKMVFEVEDAAGNKVKQLRNPLLFSKTPATFKHLEPERGQHTEEVLRQLGYGTDEIESLAERSVVIRR